MLTTPQVRALEILSEQRTVTPMSFGQFMWPTSDRKAHHLARSAGGYLAKLREWGWVKVITFDRTLEYRITQTGRMALQEHRDEKTATDE